MFDFANAKTATANAYAFKLRCAFVHARLRFACWCLLVSKQSVQNRLNASLTLARRF
ncbi:hypothetical protein [Helicobacter pylori]|uniref:hypothetical protein n=1 Tax=Helicobacter pylori TaxID=210 RepID=UPI0030BDE975